MKTSKKTIKMNTKILLMGCGMVLMTFATGCSKDNPLNPAGDCFSGKWAEQYAGELDTWINAGTAYNENPTQANCADYKNAGKAYVDALEELYDCIPTAIRTDIDADLKEAKAEIDNESCAR